MDKKEMVKELNINKSQRRALNNIEEENRRSIFSIRRYASNGLFVEAVNNHTRVVIRYTVGQRGKLTEIREA